MNIYIIFGIICAICCVIFIIAAVIQKESAFLVPMLAFCALTAIFIYGGIMTGTYNCPQCNAEIPRQANCCTYCGDILDAEGIATINQSTEDSAICKKCGHELPKDANFCSRCGEQVHNTYCNGCGKKLDSETFCPDCGLDLRVADNISNASKNVTEEK